jgi:hypothetical protein
VNAEPRGVHAGIRDLWFEAVGAHDALAGFVVVAVRRRLLDATAHVAGALSGGDVAEPR